MNVGGVGLRGGGYRVATFSRRQACLSMSTLVWPTHLRQLQHLVAIHAEISRDAPHILLLACVRRV